MTRRKSWDVTAEEGIRGSVEDSTGGEREELSDIRYQISDIRYQISAIRDQETKRKSCAEVAEDAEFAEKRWKSFKVQECGKSGGGDFAAIPPLRPANCAGLRSG
jgi:hypothetical protein